MYHFKIEKIKQRRKENMIFEKSFIRLVLIVTLAAICIKYYNEVEANLLEKLTYRRVKQEFRCALKRRRNRLPTSSQPNQITSSVLTLTQQGITTHQPNSTELSTTSGKL